MAVYSNGTLTLNLLPGLAHSTLAGVEHGLRELAVWSQRIAAGAGTPPHRHDCEEVVVVLEGSGVIAMDGVESPFAAGDTIVVAPNKAHQIFNTGAGDLRLIAAFSTATVLAEFPDGSRTDLPWQQGA